MNKEPFCGLLPTLSYQKKILILCFAYSDTFQVHLQSITWFAENYFNVSESSGLFSREGRLRSQVMKVSPSILGLSKKTRIEHAHWAAKFSVAVLTHSPTRLMHVWVFVKAS